MFLSLAKSPRPSARRSGNEATERFRLIFSHAPGVTRNGTSWATACPSSTGAARSERWTDTHTQDGPWDLLIGHPPCTFLSVAGAVRLFDKNHEIKDHARFVEGLKAAVFFLRFLAADCPKIAVENPTQISVFNLPRPTQAIQPYEHGDPWHKRTCLWLKGLPNLVPTKVVEPTGYWVQRSGQRAKGFTGGHRDPKMRSKTFPGIAAAMAEQWGGLEAK